MTLILELGVQTLDLYFESLDEFISPYISRIVDRIMDKDMQHSSFAVPVIDRSLSENTAGVRLSVPVVEENTAGVRLSVELNVKNKFKKWKWMKPPEERGLEGRHLMEKIVDEQWP